MFVPVFLLLHRWRGIELVGKTAFPLILCWILPVIPYTQMRACFSCPIEDSVNFLILFNNSLPLKLLGVYLLSDLRANL